MSVPSRAPEHRPAAAPLGSTLITLPADAALPGLATAADASTMLALLERWLRERLERPALRLVQCDLRYFKWKPGICAWLAYEVRIEPEETAWVCARLVPAWSAGPEPGRRRARPDAWIAELPMALWLLPHEPRLRGLGAAMRARFARRLICAAHPALLEQGYHPAKDARLQVIRYKPLRRALVRAHLRMRGRLPRLHRGLILRAYARSGQAEAVHQAALALHDRGSSVARHLRLPRPLGCDARRKLRWEETVSGSPLTDGFGVPEAMSAVRRLGRGIAALHRLELPLPRRRDAGEELRRLSACMRGLEAWGPPFAGEARQLLRALIQRSFNLDGWPLRPIHGDLHPAQILVRRGQRPALLDFDELALGDPLADLACWEAHLALVALRGDLTREAAAAVSAALRRSWGRALEAQEEDVSIWLDTDRLRWQRAAALLRLAEAPLRDLRPGGAAGALGLLGAARRALDSSAPRRARTPLPAVAPALRKRLRDALHADEMGREVEALLDRAGGSTSLETIRTRQIWPAGDRAWQVVYDLRLRGPRGKERSWACLRLAVHGEEAAPAGDGAFRFSRRTGGLLSIFPHDRALDHLPRALDARTVRRALARAELPDRFVPPGRLRTIAIEPVSWRPELRAVLRFRLRSAAGDRTLYAKAVPSRARMERLQRTLEAMRPLQGGAAAGGAGTESAALPSLRLLVFPQQHGRPLFDFLAEAAAACDPAGGFSPHLEELARRAGAAAARLHSAAPPMEKHFDFEAELGVVRGWVEAAEVLFPAQASSLHAALATLRAAAGKAAPAPPCARLVHRDFYDRQILFDAERTWIIDLDTACLGDPALDVGNFLAHLSLRSLQHHWRSDAYQPLRRAFMSGYGEEAIPGDPDLLGRSRFYEITSLLRLAALYMFRPRWQSLFYPLFGLARRMTGDLR